MATEKLLTPQDAAQRLNVVTKTVREWLKRGELPGVKLGRNWRIREEDLNAYINSKITGKHEGGMNHAG